MVGGATGAALGAAIGSAGGEDGPWIGALVGSLLGGAVGNSVSVPGDSYYVERPAIVHEASYYEPRWASRPVYRSPGYRSYRPRPVIVEEVVIEEPEPAAAPYGFMLPEGEIRSPHSDFTMSVGGLRPGQIVYDGLNGKPFMIP